ncbi:MAG: LytTR family transcriptional regulator [Proteobacteria bacterium]|nr:LytTR family transcriptional regulator [Pseudomonadota bacterium]
MTVTAAPDPGQTAPPARRVGWGAILLLLASMAVVSTVISVTRVSDMAGTSKAISLRESLAWDFTSTAALALLLPAILQLARRLPLPSPRPLRTLALHALASVPVSAAHVALMGVFRWALYGAVGAAYDPLKPLRNGVYEYRKDVLSYAAVVAFFWAWPTLRRIAEQAGARPAPAEAEVLEVRDGARRHFVRAADIAWVEAAGNYVALHLDDRELLMRSPLAALEARLTAAGFARIHRSRLVNRARIASVAATASGDFTVTLRDGRTLAGSRRYRRTLSGAASA